MKKVNPVISRLSLAVYALVENCFDSPYREGEWVSYAEACEMMNLSADETEAVLALIDDDLRVI